MCLVIWAVSLMGNGVFLMQGYIYLIENKINKKKYIGQTQYSLEIRMKDHLKSSSRFFNRPLYYAIRKYGIESFEISILEICDIELLSDKEKNWIQYYNTYYGDGYNATLGGEGRAIINKIEILNLYKKHQNISEVSRISGVSSDSISKIVHSSNIIVLTNSEVMKKEQGKAISAYSLNGEFIKSFNSQCEAGQWIIDQNKTKITDVKKLSYIIGRTAKGLNNRTQSYGYQWRYH